MSEIDQKILAELAAAVGPEQVSVRRLDRAIYSRDVWPRNTMRLAAGELPPLPELVVWPGTVEEVQAVVRIAAKVKLPMIPMGAGSGVCGGTVALDGRGMIVDLKRLDRLLELDEQSLTVTAQAGMIGEILERRLNQRGYTLGHFPSSIYCSSFGGWLSTRAAGQLSAKYGKIEDMVLGLQVVLPSGEVLQTRPSPRPIAGPDWNQAFIGAEGTLGLITAATCRVWPFPASRRFQAFNFARLEDGLAAIRAMLQAELRPATIRLYDPVDTFFSRISNIIPHHEPGEAEEATPQNNMAPIHREHHKNKAAGADGGLKRRLIPFLLRPGAMNPWLGRLNASKMILTFEGDPEITRLEKSQARGTCSQAGGIDMGEAPARHWWDKRYKVSYTMSGLFHLGMFADTIEVATTWDNLANLYYGMRTAISPHALVMAHFSHAYPQGCSIYFSIAAAGRNQKEKLARYDQVWESALDACVRLGGSISHHHGVGILKAKWMASEHGGEIPLLQRLKDAIDPDNLMNPGKLGLVSRGRERQQHRAAMGGITVVTKTRPNRLEQILARELQDDKRIALNPINQIAEVGAGVTLAELEQDLNRGGFTLGGHPIGAGSRTVGQCLMDRNAETTSPKVDHLANLVLSLAGNLPDGAPFRSNSSPRSAVGPDLDKIIIGAGGQLAVITRAFLAVRPLAQWESGLYAIAVRDFAAGCAALRGLMREGALPAAAEFCDSHFFRGGPEAAWGTGTGWELRVGFSGPDQPLTRALAARGLELCRRLPGPAAAPAANTAGGPAPSGGKPSFFALGQVLASWGRIEKVYAAAVAAIAAHGEPAALVNRVYPTGACLRLHLFTPGGAEPAAPQVEAARRDAFSAAAAAGGVPDEPGWLPADDLTQAILRELKA
jgi:alkyldihydroxyacetonephosphate synthase